MSHILCQEGDPEILGKMTGLLGGGPLLGYCDPREMEPIIWVLLRGRTQVFLEKGSPDGMDGESECRFEN